MTNQEYPDWTRLACSFRVFFYGKGEIIMSWKNQRGPASQKNNTKGIDIGSLILFNRKNKEIEGVVHTIRENSVIVQVDIEVQKYLEIENDLTVVNHKNYRVMN